MGTGGFDLEIKYGQGIEFEEDGSGSRKKGAQKKDSLCIPELSAVMRHGFRAPATDSYPVAVTISGTTYPVYNLAAKGVGFFIDEKPTFKPGQKIPKILLNLGPKKYTLPGEVIHVSLSDARYLCGIEFTKMSGDCADDLRKFLMRSRETLFLSK